MLRLIYNFVLLLLQHHHRESRAKHIISLGLSTSPSYSSLRSVTTAAAVESTFSFSSRRGERGVNSTLIPHHYCTSKKHGGSHLNK